MNFFVTGNSANGGSGGGIFNRGSGLSVRNCTIEDNVASDGGGISSYSAVTEIIDSTITNNTVSFISTIGNTEIGSGGGVHHEGTGSTTITKTNITNNNTGFRGGGVFGEPSSGSRGSITITNSVVSGNFAVDI